MRKILASGAAAAALFAAGAAAAGEYAVIAFDKNTGFVRLDNIQVSDGYRIVEAVRLWPETQTLSGKPAYRYVVVGLKVDCSGRRSQDLSLDLYFENHDHNRLYNDPDDWRDVLPDSMGEAMLEAACAPESPKLERVRADSVSKLVQPHY